MSSPAAAWRRFVKLVSADIPESELTMMPLEDLQAVMTAFGVTSAVEMARIEVQWKVFQKQNMFATPVVRRGIQERVLTEKIAESIGSCQNALQKDEHLRPTTNIMSPPRPVHCISLNYNSFNDDIVQSSRPADTTHILSPSRRRSASVGSTCATRKPLHTAEFEVPKPQLEKCLQKKTRLGSDGLTTSRSDPNTCVKSNHNKQKETGRGCFSPTKCWGETSQPTELSEIKLSQKKVPDSKVRRGNPSEMATDTPAVPPVGKLSVTANPNASNSKQSNPLPKPQKKTYTEKHPPLQGATDQYIRPGKVVSEDLPRPNITIPHKMPLHPAGISGSGDPNILSPTAKDPSTGKKLGISKVDTTPTPPWFGPGPKPPVPNPPGRPGEGIMPWNNTTVPSKTNKCHLKGRPDAAVVETAPPAPSQRRRAPTRGDSGVMPGASGWVLG